MEPQHSNRGEADDVFPSHRVDGEKTDVGLSGRDARHRFFSSVIFDAFERK